MILNSEHQRLSFSQFGEDGVLSWTFYNRRNGFYVDVGCHHPFRFSNTALLHTQQGWRGLNIDVDPRAIEAFAKARPTDINVLAGIAGEEREMEVTIFEEGAINSFDPTQANHPAWAHIPRRQEIVTTRPLASILAEHLPKGQVVDYMNIDAEGLDLAVLTSNDWQLNNPQVISVESHDLVLDDLCSNRTYLLLREKGYRLFSHVALTSFYEKTP